MGRVPPSVDGLDARTVADLRSGPNDWAATLRRQNADVDRANVYGSASNDAVAAIAVLLALTAVVEVVTSAARE